MSRRRLAGVLAMILAICTAARPAMAAVDPAASFQVDSNSWQQWPQAADIQAVRAAYPHITDDPFVREFLAREK